MNRCRQVAVQRERDPGNTGRQSHDGLGVEHVAGRVDECGARSARTQRQRIDGDRRRRREKIHTPLAEMRARRRLDTHRGKLQPADLAQFGLQACGGDVGRAAQHDLVVAVTDGQRGRPRDNTEPLLRLIQQGVHDNAAGRRNDPPAEGIFGRHRLGGGVIPDLDNPEVVENPATGDRDVGRGDAQRRDRRLDRGTVGAAGAGRRLHQQPAGDPLIAEGRAGDVHRQRQGAGRVLRSGRFGLTESGIEKNRLQRGVGEIDTVGGAAGIVGDRDGAGGVPEIAQLELQRCGLRRRRGVDVAGPERDAAGPILKGGP